MASADSSSFDGFISYSHAADDLLAPRLQAGLQRFAKPWWKRRALRVFRDEASLSANPHLWSSITEALDGSSWFVLLLSEDAAASEWVNREVEYWLQHRDAARIIPVVTDGEFGWDAGDVSVSSTAAPPALSGVFTEEPRWVDLRWARTEEQLDLNNARFRDGIADIASAIRQVPKDELESEEVRQHRRTIRTAWAAGIVLLLLGVAASVAAVIAVDEQQRANEEADRANQAAVDEATARAAAEASATAEAEARAEAEGERDRADALASAEAQARGDAEVQRQIAEDERDTAQAERDRADAEARTARAEALAANSQAVLDGDPELAVLLAAQALELEPRTAALAAMHTALQAHRTIFQVELAPGDFTAAGGLSPDGKLLVVARAFTDEFDVWDIDAGALLWTASTSGEPVRILNAGFTIDGSELVAIIIGDFMDGNPAPAELRVYDALTGEPTRVIDAPDCTGSKYFPGVEAPFFDLSRPMVWARDDDCDFFGTPEGEVGLLDPATGKFEPILPIRALPLTLIGTPTTDAENRLIGIDDAEGSGGRVIDVATGDIVFEYPGGLATLSADGKRLIAGSEGTNPMELRNVETGALLWKFNALFTRAWFSEDESMVYGTSLDGSTYVIDAATGFEIFRLRGHTGLQREVVMSSDNARIATFSADGIARVWDIGSVALSEGPTFSIQEVQRDVYPGTVDAAGGRIAMWSGGADGARNILWETIVLDAVTGEVVFSAEGGSAALSDDGALLAYRPVEGGRIGDVRVVELATGEVVAELDAPCNPMQVGGLTVPADGCTGREASPEFLRWWDVDFSPDGRLLGLTDGADNLLVVFDVATGGIVLEDRIPGLFPGKIDFSPDGSIAVATFAADGAANGVRVYDLETAAVVTDLEIIGSVSGTAFTADQSILVGFEFQGGLVYYDTSDWSLIEHVAAHQGNALHMDVNPSGTLVATSGPNEVRVWNVADRSLHTEVGLEGRFVGSVSFLDDTHLLAIPRFRGIAIVISLDPEELAEIGNSRVTRAFTAVECETFDIDPCPMTLEALRGG